jgi:O-antigen ligase
LLCIALFFILAGNVVRVDVFNVRGGAPLGLNDLAVLGVLAIGALAMGYARSIRLDGVALLAMVFIAVGGLSAVAGIPRFGLSGHELAVSLAYLARWVVYFGIYVVVINCVRSDDAPSLWSALEWTMLLFAAFGIVQSAFLPSFFETVRGGELIAGVDHDPQGSRLVSTVLEPNVAAAMLLTVLVPQLALIACGRRVAAWKPLLLFAALALTISRSGLLGLIAGVAVILWVRGVTRSLLRFGLPVLLVLLAALPRVMEYAATFGKTGFIDPSSMARVVVWLRALDTFLDHPWIGIGFNTYAFVQERRGFAAMNNAAYSAEGGLLFVLVMTGIVGLLVYVAMLWMVVRHCRRTWRDASATAEQRSFAIGAVAATVSILVHSMFVNSLLVPFVMEPLWVLWGIAFLLRVPPRFLRIDARPFRLVPSG